VNTVYFASSPEGGYQMSRIARLTGGTYIYWDDKASPQDVFDVSRRSYVAERLHLLEASFGERAGSRARQVLQALLAALLCFACSCVAQVMLDNRDLLRAYLAPKAAFALLCGAAFALVLSLWPVKGAPWARAALALGMCLVAAPTYRMPPQGG
jgi:hypothetical protein